MNLSLTLTIDEMRNPPECRHQAAQLEIYDSYCLMNDCNMAFLCRNPYSMTPITLVSHGSEVVIRSTCSQYPGIDCAVINYRLFDPLTEMGSCHHGTDRHYWQVNSFWSLEHTWNVNSGQSALDMTWWIENTSPVEEMLIQIMENQLSRSPDCVQERIEIYTGQCMNVTNMVTYFCGGVKDSYKLANSRYAAVRFIGSTRSNYYADRDICVDHNPDTYIPYTPDPAYPDYGSYLGPYPVPAQPEPYSPKRENMWDQFAGLWITLILVAGLVSVVVVIAQYSKKKKARSGTVIQNKFQNRSYPTAPVSHPPRPPAMQHFEHRGSIQPQTPYVGPQQHPPPMQFAEHRESIIPQTAPVSSQLYSQPSSPGIPPPSTYDLPPAYAFNPYHGQAPVQVTVHHSPHFPAPPYRQ